MSQDQILEIQLFSDQNFKFALGPIWFAKYVIKTSILFTNIIAERVSKMNSSFSFLETWQRCFKKIMYLHLDSDLIVISKLNISFIYVLSLLENSQTQQYSQRKHEKVVTLKVLMMNHNKTIKGLLYATSKIL